jgi:hypothetical protein
MIDRERTEAEARRRHIAAQSRAANPPRKHRIIPAADRDSEMLGRMGFTVHSEDDSINWAALTKA